MYAVQIEGRPATVEEPAPLAFASYGHFTAMQVRNRRVQGLSFCTTPAVTLESDAGLKLSTVVHERIPAARGPAVSRRARARTLDPWEDV